jgi:hypothetical protein
MAEVREQINPKVAGTTKTLLLRYCQEKHTTQGDVVDAALVAFLQPKADDALSVMQMDLLRSLAETVQAIAAKQDSLEQGVAALVPLLTTIVERLEKPQPEPEPPPPIADYAQLYKELRTDAPSADDADNTEPSVVIEDVSAPTPARWGWFFTRRTAP